MPCLSSPYYARLRQTADRLSVKNSDTDRGATYRQLAKVCNAYQMLIKHSASTEHLRAVKNSDSELPRAGSRGVYPAVLPKSYQRVISECVRNGPYRDVKKCDRSTAGGRVAGAGPLTVQRAARLTSCSSFSAAALSANEMPEASKGSSIARASFDRPTRCSATARRY